MAFSRRSKKILEIGAVVDYQVILDKKPSLFENNGYGDQEISNQNNLTWRYIGINNAGEIMIAPDITENAPKLYLVGEYGYLKGPNEIARLCRELYSTDKGKADSMTIEDVNKLLGYTGEKGGYCMQHYVPTPDKVLTIAEIEKIWR